MDLGEMKDRIVFKESTVTTGPSGNVGTYNSILTTWAKVKQLDQTRSLAYGLIDSYQNFEITIRHRSDITINRDLLIVFRGKELNIHSVVEDRLKSYTIIAFQNA